MKFLVLFCAGIFSAVTVFSQKNANNSERGYGKQYSIIGKLTNVRGRKIYLKEVDSWNRNNFQDSTMADATGKFIFHGKLTEPLMSRIQIGDHSIDFYLENSSIQLDGNADSIWLASLTGCKEENTRQEYQNKIWLESKGGIIKEYRAIMDGYRKAGEDSIAVKKMDEKKALFFSKLENAIKGLMQKYPVSIASVDEVSYFIDKHLNSDYDYSEPDSLLRRFESSSIGYYHQVKFLRDRINSYKAIAIGNYAPEFSQADTAGKQVLLSSFKQRYVLLDFWASWCGPCRAGNPALVKLYETYKDKNFTIVSISLDEEKEKWMNAIHSDSLFWTNLSDVKGRENEVAMKYGINGIPFNLLLDTTGKIIAINIHGEALSKKLNELF